MDIFLTTDRLVLRRFTMADEDNAVELDSDPAVMRYLTGKPTPRAEIRTDYLPAWLSYYTRYTGYGFWAAEARAEFIGWFHLRPPVGSPPDEPELGYRLRKSAWGKGYATEGARALIDSAFTESGAQRVFARTMTVNTGSRRVMKKSGLTLIRTFHQDWPDHVPGDELGDVEYAITKQQWLATRPWEQLASAPTMAEISARADRRRARGVVVASSDIIAAVRATRDEDCAEGDDWA